MNAPDLSTGEFTPAVDLQAPALRRRLAAFIYEGVLLFGVLMIAGLVYSPLTQMRDARDGRFGLQLFLFLVLGIYFVWFWTRGGQTVAMKAWHIRLVDAQGRPVSQPRAAVRFLLSWLWFAPAWFAAKAAGLHGASIFGVMFAGVVAYAVLSYLHPKRQFWHDVVCGTRLIESRPKKAAKA